MRVVNRTIKLPRNAFFNKARIIAIVWGAVDFSSLSVLTKSWLAMWYIVFEQRCRIGCGWDYSCESHVKAGLLSSGGLLSILFRSFPCLFTSWFHSIPRLFPLSTCKQAIPWLAMYIRCQFFIFQRSRNIVHAVLTFL